MTTAKAKTPNARSSPSNARGTGAVRITHYSERPFRLAPSIQVKKTA